MSVMTYTCAHCGDTGRDTLKVINGESICQDCVSKCADCGIDIPTLQLSGLGTCPACVKLWVKSYRGLHDKRYGKRVKA
jgi:DNA-directed RNA polymerase subunit RPC12/RpoP